MEINVRIDNVKGPAQLISAAIIECESQVEYLQSVISRNNRDLIKNQAQLNEVTALLTLLRSGATVVKSVDAVSDAEVKAR